MQNENQNQPAPNDTKALNDLIEQKRLELGIKPGSMPTQITAAMPAREMSAEEISARDEEAKRMALAEQQARRQGMFAVLCGKVGDRYARCSFDAYQITSDRQKAAVAACKEFAATLPERMLNGTSLVLFGPVGTGKDHLAFAVCAAAILRHGKHVGWVNGQEWFGQIRDEMCDGGRSEHSLIQRLASPDLLVISDPLPPIGSLTQHQATMLYRLIDARYVAAKSTIITVNVQSSEEADERMGIPTWDRLRDNAWQVFCNWPSYRKPARIINGN